MMWTVAQVPAADDDALRRACLRNRASLLLVAVALFGDVVNGARRWLNLGVVRIQPSEIMKIAMPLMLAWYFDKHEATLAAARVFRRQPAARCAGSC